MQRSELDHIVVAAARLEHGVEWIAQRLGVEPQPGGKHVAMGTHNALLKLGPRAYPKLSPLIRTPQRRRDRAGFHSTSRRCSPAWRRGRR
jgi:hypothetical protein